MHGNHQITTDDERYRVMDLLIPAVFDEISEIVSIKLPDHTILFYNRAGYEMLGKTPEEVLGRKCYELLGESDTCSHCPADKANQTGKSHVAETYFDSIKKWFEVNARPVCDKNGQVIYLIEILRDITHLKTLQEELAKYESQ